MNLNLTEPQARDQKVVDEFRANGGVVGGTYAKMPLLLLHHTGAKSGAAHITPLAYLADEENWVIFAANSGRPTHPGWYRLTSSAAASPPADVAATTGSVHLRRIRSLPAGLPVTAGSPQMPIMSSTNWKARPISLPNLSASDTVAGSAPAHSAPTAQAHPMSAA